MKATRFAQLFIFIVAFSAVPAFAEEPEWRALLDRIEKAYAAVTDYRAKVEVRTYGNADSFEAERFLYTFKKPKFIRLEFESPYRGMVLVYPDKDGKAAIRLPWYAGFVKFYLAPDSPLIRASCGQPIDTTDLRSLIEHIARTCMDERRSAIELWYEGESAVIRVEGLNHFRNEAPTLYEFTIDNHLWLPVSVKEMTPRGTPQRAVIFHNLEINRDIPESSFRLDGDNVKY